MCLSLPNSNGGFPGRNYELRTLYSVILKAMFPNVGSMTPQSQDILPEEKGSVGHRFGKH